MYFYFISLLFINMTGFLLSALGGELFDRLLKGRCEENEARGIMRQVAAGVGYLHEKGIAHRDLKVIFLLLLALCMCSCVFVCVWAPHRVLICCLFSPQFFIRSAREHSAGGPQRKPTHQNQRLWPRAHCGRAGANDHAVWHAAICRYEEMQPMAL